METQLVACVRDSLDNFLYDNAKFMCERLYAEHSSEENLLLLATVYMRADQSHRAYHLLARAQFSTQEGLSLHGRYLLAQSAFKLGLYDEAKIALSENSKGEMPGDAAGYYLLGKLYSLTDNPNHATTAYQAALVRNPLLWSAYEGLCQLGYNEHAASILNQSELARETSAGGSRREHLHPSHSNGVRPMQSSTSPSPQRTTSLSADAPVYVPTPGAIKQLSNSQKFAFQSFQENLGQNDHATPASSGSTTFVTPSPGMMSQAGPAAPARMHAGVGPRETPTPTPMWRGGGRHMETDSSSDRRKFLDEGKLRKVSNRLSFADSASAASPNVTTRRGSRAAAASNTVSHPNPAAGPVPPPRFLASQPASFEHLNGHASPLPEGEASREGAAAVLQLLQVVGEAYGLLCMYHCKEAISVLDCLSPAQYETPWVLCQVGRACFEMVRYPEAAEAFERSRALDPTRLEDMEMYSTVLWHLRREVDLSHLAQAALALDRLDPRAWCIMGNCFSLQKDQLAALKFFQRALQLDPTFTYAYTLAGHENLALEQFDKSMACFRNAMRLDPRHYNAWYGVGQIYYRQEKYEMAAYHFASGLKINGESSILRCYNGMALAKMNRHEDAVTQLRDAITADPHNPLARLELAAVLQSAHCLEEALQELHTLKDKAPKEASVYFQIGKIYRRLDQTETALMYFSHALDLKPSSSDVNMIKSAIEKLKISNESDEEEI